MVRISRGAMMVASASVLVMAGLFAACGLDESGLLNGDASINADVNADTLIIPDVQVDNYIPNPCSNQDASIDVSCLPSAVPTGWIPVGMKVGDSNVVCPGIAGDFVAKQYVKDPTPDTNSCGCGGSCGQSGSWSCEQSIYAGSSCTGYIDAGSNGALCVQTSHGSFSATLTRTGSATCAGAPVQNGTLDASATPVGACVPQKCQADFCGLAQQQFSLCILNTSVTDGGCPTGFPNASVVGLQAFTACTQCTCDFTNPNAPCTGTISAYGGTNCDSGLQSTIAADGGCGGTFGYNSLLLQPDQPPAPNCVLSGSTGEAMLAGPATICCP